MGEQYVPQEEIEFNRSTESRPETSQYHFGEIEQIAQNAEELVGQLKDNIDAGKYNVLISDEAGARITTLIIKKVINRVHPELPLHTYFVSGGHSIKNPENLPQLNDRLADIEHHEEDPRVLLVTQYVHSGRSIQIFAEAIHSAGMSNLDVASLNTPDVEQVRDMLPEEVGLFAANWRPLQTDENHEHLSGVKKTSPYRAYPETIFKSIDQHGRDLGLEDWQKIYGIEPEDPPWEALDKMRNNPEADAELERVRMEPLSDDEIAEINKNIRLVREDINTLAEQIVSNVWENN